MFLVFILFGCLNLLLKDIYVVKDLRKIKVEKFGSLIILLVIEDKNIVRIYFFKIYFKVRF